MKKSDLPKWDGRFLELARHVAEWSRGPRTKVGAVLARPDKSIASLGYNGPPRGFDDELFLRMERSEQHKIVIHAEDNAIRQAHEGEDLTACTMYVTHLPCEACARKIVKAGIKRVVAYCGHMSQDWLESAKVAENIFRQNGVSYVFVKD